MDGNESLSSVSTWIWVDEVINPIANAKNQAARRIYIALSIFLTSLLKFSDWMQVFVFTFLVSCTDALSLPNVYFLISVWISQGKEKGQALLNQAFYHQSVCEPRYFGLRFLGINCSVQHWVEPDKSLSHQLKCNFLELVIHFRRLRYFIPTTGFSGEIHFYFEVKYFVENPSQLTENQTRWLFFLQCWNNVCNGTLVTSPQTCCVLASYYLHRMHN